MALLATWFEFQDRSLEMGLWQTLLRSKDFFFAYIRLEGTKKIKLNL